MEAQVAKKQKEIDMKKLKDNKKDQDMIDELNALR